MELTYSDSLCFMFISVLHYGQVYVSLKVISVFVLACLMLSVENIIYLHTYNLHYRSFQKIMTCLAPLKENCNSDEIFQSSMTAINAVEPICAGNIHKII